MCPEIFDWIIFQGVYKAGHLVRNVKACPAFHVFPAIPIPSVIGLVILVVPHVSWPVLCPCRDTITSSLGSCCVLPGSTFSLALVLALTHTLLFAFPPPLQGAAQISRWSHIGAEASKRSGDAYCGSPGITQSIFDDNDLLGRNRKPYLGPHNRDAIQKEETSASSQWAAPSVTHS